MPVARPGMVRQAGTNERHLPIRQHARAQFPKADAAGPCRAPTTGRAAQCSPSASTTAPIPSARSSSAAATARNSAAASSTTRAATRASCSTRATTILARQHPGDYLFGLEKQRHRRPGPGRKKATASAQRRSSASASTPPARARSPSTSTEPPLALHTKWANNLAAQCWLWKDHTSWREAASASPSSPPQHRPAVHRQVRQHLFLRMVVVARSGTACNVAPDGLRRRLLLGRALPTGSPPCSPASPTRAQVKRGVCAAGHKALYCRRMGRPAGQGVSRAARPEARRAARPPL